MILRAEQMFDKMYLDGYSGFIDYISHAIEREMVIKMIDKLQGHKLFVVQMREPEIIEEVPGLYQSAYRQDLECLEIVQCKNCRMNFRWCQKFRDELNGNGFCPYGAEAQSSSEIQNNSERSE